MGIDSNAKDVFNRCHIYMLFAMAKIHLDCAKLRHRIGHCILDGEVLRYITTSNLYWDRFDLNEVRMMPFTDSEIEKCRVTKGDLLVCEGGDIGRAAIWPYDYDVMIQNHIHRLRSKADISVRFFYYIFLLYKQLGFIGGKGIAILGLSLRELDKMVVPVPPVPEQRRIVTAIENLFAKMDAIASNLS